VGVWCVLVGLLFFYYKGFWLGNHLDDGYYITKVATIPYTDGNYSMNYAVGVAKEGFDTYLFNTWELEASVYVQALGVPVTLFLRLFQSAFYYLLFIVIIKEVSVKIMQAAGIQKKELYQLPCVIVIFFGCYSVFLSSTKLLPLRDTFHINTGMFLGGTLPKVVGILLLFLCFLDETRSVFRRILPVCAISFYMVTRSTVAVPMLVVGVTAGVILCIVEFFGTRGNLIAFGFMLLFLAIGYIFPNHAGIEDAVYSDVQLILASPAFWCVVVICILSFLFREKIIYKINFAMLWILGMMLLPELNDTFETFCVYRFVGGRTWTTWVYTLFVLATIYLCIFFVKIKMRTRMIRVWYGILAMILCLTAAYGFDRTGGTVIEEGRVIEANLKGCLRVLKENPDVMPKDTVEIGELLSRLSDEVDEQLRVVSPQWVWVDEMQHPPSIFLRIYAPKILSITASWRYPVDGEVFANYTQEGYEQFVNNPSGETMRVFEAELESVDANCVVITGKQVVSWMEQMGFVLYGVTSSGESGIWYRGEACQ
jgi:hypothetical protein